ncbi:MAG: fructose-bisphosphatase class III [Clostridia bacterium]|nr:fructose-bisphosphatase class III [Clostridia bacterium]
MIYAMADLYGDYTRFTEMLDRIHFGEQDTLYLLGNLTAGEDGVKLLLDLSARPNVFPLIGDLEYTALPLLRKLCGDLADGAANMDADTLRAFALWGQRGGQEFVRAFRALSEEDRAWLIEYLEEFSPYEEVEAGGKDFLLVHAGLDNFSRTRDLDDYSLDEMLFTKPDFEKVYFDDKILVTGHTPTVDIHPDCKGRIFSLNHHIALNTGAQFGLPLGCIRLDDLKEFYVE